MPVDGKITLEDREVRAAIGRVLLGLPLGGSMRPAFRSIGRVVKSGTQLRFRKQQTPEGVRWKPSQRVLREGGQTLRLSGRLQRSYTFREDDASVEVGTNTVYGAIQHFGGWTGRGHKTHIDPRPALGVSADDKQGIVEVLNGFIGGRWAGR